MKMAKPSQADIDAAGNLMVLLDQIDRGDFPCTGEVHNVPDFFDEDNVEHLRAFYLAVKSTLEAAPGYQGRVIAGMCYVIMFEENEIIDPASDVLDLHPRLVAALQGQAEQNAVLEEAAKLAIKFTAVPRDVLGPATVHMKTLAAVGEKISAAIRDLGAFAPAPGRQLTVPEGYAIVPLEPTGVMKDAGASAIPISASSTWVAADVWRAMARQAVNQGGRHD